jgi:hypothetical protein
MFKNYNHPCIAKYTSSVAIDVVKDMLQEYKKLNFEIFKEKFIKELKEKLDQDERGKKIKDNIDYNELAKLVYRHIAEYYIANKSFKGLGEYLKLINFIVDGELTLRNLKDKELKESLF